MNYPDTCNLLGIEVAITDMNRTLSYIQDNMNASKGRYICVSNVHTTVLSYENPVYRQIQNNAAMVLPDGKPLSVVERMRGYKEAQKVSGPDLMPEIFKISEAKGYTQFFYGSTEETLVRLQSKLLKRYPRLKIVGMISPPFRKLSEEEDQNVIDQINASKADFLWVGLGAPKQEIWMAEHEDKVHSLMIGVGAGFDFHAGTIKRAPVWMQKVGLEWFYRLTQDPKRLWKRYIETNTKFVWYLIRERFGRMKKG